MTTSPKASRPEGARTSSPPSIWEKDSTSVGASIPRKWRFSSWMRASSGRMTLTSSTGWTPNGIGRSGWLTPIETACRTDSSNSSGCSALSTPGSIARLTSTAGFFVMPSVSEASVPAADPSAGRPAHVAAAEDVPVQVQHALTGVGADVRDEAPAVLELLILGHLAGGLQEPEAEIRVVQLGNRGDVAVGDEQHVRGRLRVQVAEAGDVLVLVDDVALDLPRRNLAEDAVSHARSPLRRRRRPGL